MKKLLMLLPLLFTQMSYAASYSESDDAPAEIVLDHVQINVAQGVGSPVSAVLESTDDEAIHVGQTYAIAELFASEGGEPDAFFSRASNELSITTLVQSEGVSHNAVLLLTDFDAQEFIVIRLTSISVDDAGVRTVVIQPGIQDGTGVPGPQGSTGPQGPPGTPGIDGAVGAIGATGAQGPAGPTGTPGTDGAVGATGAIGAQGPAGQQGPVGTPGTDGVAGATGAQGPAGPQGSSGTPGLSGAVGAMGATGPQGPAGATGPQGLTGPSGVLSFGHFFALMPPDNAATVAPGTDVSFPQDGPTSLDIFRTGPSSFNLSAIGVYEVTSQVSVTEAGQLILTLNGADLAYTVAGRATGTSQITNQVLIQTTVTNSVLTVRNPDGNSTALTITPLAGGTRPVAASLIIKQIQ